MSFGTQLNRWKSINGSVYGIIEAIVSGLDINELCVCVCVCVCVRGQEIPVTVCGGGRSGY